MINCSTRDRRSSRLQVLHLFWPILLMPSVSHALECPRVPEQARNDLEIVVRSAVGKIGAAKESELESSTRTVTRDLLGKLPKADKVYLELMMYAAYCSTLRDDAALTEAQKSARIRAYNLELKKVLEGVERDGVKYRADPRDVARAELERIPLPYTTDAFVESVKQGNLKAVKLFLAAGMDPNSETRDQNFALQSGAQGGHIEIVKVLLKAKANVNQYGLQGSNAVSAAVVFGHNDILRLLLDQGPRTNILEFALELGAERGNVEAVRMIFIRGVDNRTRDEALIWAAKGNANEAQLNEVVRFLLEQGADVNAQTRGGCTALAAAAWAAHATVVQTLLDARASVNSKSTCHASKYGVKDWTVLMFALSGHLSDIHSPNHVAVVNLLLARGADPNLASKDGTTSLMIAAEFKDVTMVRNLLDKGMNPNQANNWGRTALISAVDFEGNNLEVVGLLLDRGADPNLADESGFTALITASLRAHNLDTIRLLLERGGNPNVKAKNTTEKDEFTLLMGAAANWRRTDHVEMLLDAGADVNARSKTGRTALMLAVRAGTMETVQTLLCRGAKANDEDAIGKTVLNYAEDYPHEPTRTDMIRILKKAGAK